MMANCCNISGVTSTLAPLSQTPTGPPAIFGTMGNAGRRTPSIRPILRVAAATRTPVAPLDTIASTDSSSRSIRMARIMELFFFSRTASIGLSFPVTSSGA